jgi:hypothetical protein
MPFPQQLPGCKKKQPCDVSHYQTQKVTPQNGHGEQGVGVYHMPNQNTRIGVTIRKVRVLKQRRTAEITAVLGDFSSPSVRLWKYYPHHTNVSTYRFLLLSI